MSLVCHRIVFLWLKPKFVTLNYSQAQVLAKRALECDSATAVRQLSEQEM